MVKYWSGIAIWDYVRVRNFLFILLRWGFGSGEGGDT